MTEEEYADQVQRRLEDCNASVQRDDTLWCLAVLYAKGFVLIRRDATGDAQVSEPLPVELTGIHMEEGLHYAFDSLWISHSGRPMGVLRVDPVTLAVQARFRIDTGWDSRWFGSVGEIVIGNDAVWALSNGELHRIDPGNNSESSTNIAFPVWDVGVAPGLLWTVSRDRIMKLDAGSLTILQTFTVPSGTEIRDKVYWGEERDSSGVTIADAAAARVLLTVVRPEQLPCHPECPTIFPGRIEPESGSIVPADK